MKTAEEKGTLISIFKGFVGAERKVKIAVAVGLAGMMLVLLSSFIPTGSAKKAIKGADDVSSKYITQLEDRMMSIVSSIEGVGKVKILVTLENGTEYVYAEEGKSSGERSQSFDQGQLVKSEENASTEKKYILLDIDGTGEQALLLKQVEPKIKGVVVVCEGAGNPVVNQRVTTAVTTALGISSTRVCVIKIA